jgi:hypothetical protein
MRNLKSLQFYKVATFMALLVIFSSSCKDKDKEEVLPDYAGTWVAEISIPTQTGFTAIKDIMTFTGTTFIDKGQMQTGVNTWIDFILLKGSISVNGNIMDVTVNEVGTTTISSITGLPTGSIESYKTGTTEFDNLLIQTGQPRTFKSEYSVSGNKLTLKTDNDEDGVYMGEDEITVYTRQ